MDSPLYKTDDGNFVRFRYDVAKNEAATTREGRPIYDKVLLAAVVSPGNAKQEAVHEIERTFSDGTTRRRDQLAQRFAAQLEAFHRQSSSPDLTGTPIDAWPALDVTQVAELKALNIHTVEALADLSDTGLQRVGMGARALQAKAKAFLDAAKGNAPAERLAAELKQRDEEIERLRAQIAELAAKIDAKDDDQKPGRRKSAA